jgi:hypothetical protein
MFTRALHRPLSRSRSIQSILAHLGSILILSSHLRLGFPSGFLPSDFSTKILYSFHFSANLATCPAHLILLDLIILIILSGECKSRRSSLCFALFVPQIIISHSGVLSCVLRVCSARFEKKTRTK